MNTPRQKADTKTDVRAELDSLMPANPLDRRGFIVTALGAGFALSVTPTAAQSPIKTGTEGPPRARSRSRSRTATSSPIAPCRPARPGCPW